MKKFAFVLALVMALGCLGFACAETITSGDFGYTLLEDGTAEITKYTGSALELIIPAELDGHPVTAIGDSAFEDCDTLISVTIPNSMTEIGDKAFSKCCAMTSITIPDSVVELGANPFAYCSSLTKIIISSTHPTLEIIDGVLFDKTEKELICYPCAFDVTSYTIPQGTLTIGDRAFYKCNSLTSVMIPDSVTSIEEYAFYSCNSLASITIPDSVTSIAKYAFFYCEALTSITIPDSVVKLGSNPFIECYSLTKISVSSTHPTLETIDGVLFDKTQKKLICYPCTFDATSYAIPQGTLAIGANAFREGESLSTVTIPDSVTSIGAEAFDGCKALTSVMIPDSVTSIDNGAFRNCPKLVLLTDSYYTRLYAIEKGIPFCRYISHIDGTAEIIECKGEVTELIIPAELHGCSVTSIGYSVFSGCKSLRSVTIPDSVTSIGDSAFNGCESLYSITIPDGVTSIGNYTFFCCVSLRSVTIPDSVTSIGDEAFYGCESLRTVTIPDSVTSIGDRAFWCCGDLTRITIPASVTSIGEDAFDYCFAITIEVEAGSYAEQYAKNNYIRHRVI